MNRAGRKVSLVGLGVLAVLLLAQDAWAHAKSISYSSWKLDHAGASVQLRIRLLELTRFPPGHATAEYFAEHLQLFAGTEACAPRTPTRTPNAPDGWAIFHWRIDCPETGPQTIHSRLLEEVTQTHLHFARVSWRAGSAGNNRVIERVLVQGDPSWELSGDAQPDTAAGTSLGGYVALGVEHIMAGWDHLAFVVALLLLSATLREVATLVTAFTVAHSLTLGLAVMGVFRPQPAAVEILIGFSIALVAAENAWLLAGKDRGIPAAFAASVVVALLLALAGKGALAPLAWLGLAVFSFCHFRLLQIAQRPARLRAAVAFAFGLVHGFGFAGVLMEIQLPVERLLPALFGFNVGVELGQLFVVALVWPLLTILARQRDERWYRIVAETGSAAIFGLGVFWVVTRTWNG